MENNLPKYEAPNPYNYSKIQMAKRKRDIKAMINDYPNVNAMWCEWLYDVIENTPPEEVEEIIKSGAWEVPSKHHSKAKGGVLHSVEVFNEDFTPFNSQKIISAE
jgi:hypothetical protein